MASACPRDEYGWGLFGSYAVVKTVSRRGYGWLASRRFRCDLDVWVPGDGILRFVRTLLAAAPGTRRVESVSNGSIHCIELVLPDNEAGIVDIYGGSPLTFSHRLFPGRSGDSSGMFSRTDLILSKLQIGKPGWFDVVDLMALLDHDDCRVPEHALDFENVRWHLKRDQSFADTAARNIAVLNEFAKAAGQRSPEDARTLEMVANEELGVLQRTLNRLRWSTTPRGGFTMSHPRVATSSSTNSD